MPSRSPPFPSPPLTTTQHHQTPTNLRHLLLLALTISLSSLLLLAFLFLVLYLYFSLLDRSSPTLPFDSTSTPPAATNPPPTTTHLTRFSYRDLRSATNAFDPSNSLGRGASASVFRGVLRDGKSVAVKRLDHFHHPLAPSSSSALQAHREFENELRVLGSIPASSSPFVVSLLGYCVEKKRRLLVYEYLPNRTLQEALFGSASEAPPSSQHDLDWDRRFRIILDVAQALAFLHIECDPPVIHGDIKPSNVLLGPDLRAKISDFGLSRVKTDDGLLDLGVDLFSQELFWKSQDLTSAAAANNVPDSPPVDFALALRPSCSSSNKCPIGAGGAEENADSPRGKGTMSPTMGCCEDELFSIDHSKELIAGTGGGGCSPLHDSTVDANQSGTNDWWWRQDASGELCSKDYVSEWIGSQICPLRNPDWDDDGGDGHLDYKSSPDKPEFTNSGPVEKCRGIIGDDTRSAELGLEGHKKKKKKKKKIKQKSRNTEQKEVKKSVDICCDKKHKKKMREWWKEEYFAEISKKGKCSKGFRWLRTSRMHADRQDPIASNHQSNRDSVVDEELDVGISFRKGWMKKRKRNCSVGSEMWSGDLFSKELSSTTSMRGTVCYVAPESGGCGHWMEKADIYSFGVLVLVIVSGRRPLHVLASPMKLEKANLISWCRQLAQAGNVLELVDERLTGEYNKDQASLCIHLALLCLQRMPELRPDSGEIVKILKGEMALPPLPVEFSPSPPASKHISRSRRKPKLEVE